VSLLPEVVLVLPGFLVLFFAGLRIVRFFSRAFDKHLEKRVLEELARERKFSSQMTPFPSLDERYTHCTVSGLRRSSLFQEREKRNFTPRMEVIIPKRANSEVIFAKKITRRIVKYPDGKVVIEEERREVPLYLPQELRDS